MTISKATIARSKSAKDTALENWQLSPRDLPSPPFIILPGLPNLRDIGGYAIEHPFEGRTSVRRHLIFRSADVSGMAHFPETCAKFMSDLKVKTMFDLRTSIEVSQEAVGPPLHLPGITRVEVPTRDVSNNDSLVCHYQQYARTRTMGNADILTNGAKSFSLVFRHLLQHPEEPILYHCSIGKDRTGVLTMLLLGLAGVSDEQITEEYSLSTVGIGNLKRKVVAHYVKRLAVDQDAAERMAESRAGTMLETLALMRDRYGDTAGYLGSECGFTEGEMQGLRRILTCAEPPIL